MKIHAADVEYGAAESDNLRDELIKIRDEMLGEPEVDFTVVVLLSHVIAWMAAVMAELNLE